MNRLKKILTVMILIIFVSITTACTNSSSVDNDNNKSSTVEKTETNKNNSIKDNSKEKSETIDIEKEIKNIFTLIDNREYAKLYNTFSEQVRNQVTEEQLVALLKQSFNNLSKLKGIESIFPDKINGQEVFHVKVNFEKEDIPYLIAFDKDGLITALVLDTTIQEDNSSTETNSSITETEITIGNSPWELPGKLTLPKDESTTKFPAVILVHGSGPNDMDETIGPNKVFKDIAHGLSENGIAVLRYNKRNNVYTMPESYTSKELVIDDVLEAYKYLSTHSSIDKNRIYVAGHSLGGWLIPRIAKQLPEGAGFISLAGPTRAFSETINEQLDYLLSLDINKNEQTQKALNMMKEQTNNLERGNLSDNAYENLLAHPKDFWLELEGYIAADEYKAIPQPLLVLQGEMDYQVSMKDFEVWKTILSYRDDVTFKSYSKLTHLFMESSSETELSTPSDYAVAAHVSPEVIEDIAKWITNLK
ncbi:alpha/beta fold hydrolase [Oceanirhabdus sp. W0125-5]|uniref:alpha/beta fold hydrolase n=1 Tax=Oceanirhabdus sp. W0125-5 TaxID=2999116 RepID=UPI0022F2F635|nr:alpha/beta fold hydrolase [Oceanirhabdus sp. W0125-5]WBW99185.1 alpha/beta fold hydrolase [Oceanirhabdus sp. W0125-5]